MQLIVDILVMNVSIVFFVLSELTYLFRDLYFHKCCTYILLQSCLTGIQKQKRNLCLKQYETSVYALFV